ncbi:hypothetical protein BKA60DRAFT_570152 [Fusarium oxysporum]|nr:hypothetical protein BKA60DRAFT_570152 [Fusarium oxysporum]
MPYLQRIAIEMLFLLCCFDLFCRDINMAYINLDFSEKCRGNAYQRKGGNIDHTSYIAYHR